MSAWLLTLILYLQTPALAQETSQIYDTEKFGKRESVALEMGDLYNNLNHISGDSSLNNERELWMLQNQTYSGMPTFELYADSISLWQQKTQDLSYKIYNPLINHGANITTFFDFTEHMNSFVFEYSLTYQLNTHGLRSTDNYSFCKNFIDNICQCFPLYLPPTDAGATCISINLPHLKLDHCLEKNSSGDCVMCKPGLMLMNLNVTKPECSSVQYCCTDPDTKESTNYGCLSCAQDHCVTCISGWFKVRGS